MPCCPAAMARSFLNTPAPVLRTRCRLCGFRVSVMTAVMGHMAISTDMLAAHAIMGNIDKFSTVACFGIAGATAVIVGKRIGEGAGREVYSGLLPADGLLRSGSWCRCAWRSSCLRCSSPISILCSIWRAGAGDRHHHVRRISLHAAAEGL